MADFPFVPNVPGVPALARDPFAAFPPVELLIGDVLSAIIGLIFGPVWGIFLNGIPVIVADTMATFAYKQDWNISDYPVEDGGFQAYNKVALPFDVRVRMAVGGSMLRRQVFIDSIRAIAPTLALLDVVTPEAIYTSVNIDHIDWDRSNKSVGLIVAEIWLKEIRITATAVFTNTQNPADAGQQSNGVVQATPAPGFMADRFGNWQ